MSNIFPILAIETSDKLCSVSIMIDENEYYEMNIQGKHIHSQKLVVMIDELIKSSFLTIKDIKCLAISEGPGSFTGLRIGMAAAKGIAVGANLPILHVPTFDAIALKISSFLLDGQKFAIIKKASKDDSYFAAYEINGESFSSKIPLQLIENDDVTNYVNDEFIIYSNLDSKRKEAEVTIPSSVDIARWAYKFGKDLLTSNYDLIEPRYLKEFLVRTQK